jgi:hypothetical protein
MADSEKAKKSRTKKTHNMKIIFIFLIFGLLSIESFSQSIESISFTALASSNNNFQPVAGSSFSGYVSNASGSLTIASEYGKNDFKVSSNIRNTSEEAKNDIIIYPNPTDHFILIDNFSKNTNKSNSVLITDNNGRKVFYKENYIDKTPIDFKSFQTGIYILSLTIENELITSKKIIKSK